MRSASGMNRERMYAVTSMRGLMRQESPMWYFLVAGSQVTNCFCRSTVRSRWTVASGMSSEALSSLGDIMLSPERITASRMPSTR